MVEIVPGKVGGLPVIRGSRVPADQVLENHDAGESVKDIAYNFDLKPEDIRFVLSWLVSIREPNQGPRFGRVPHVRPSVHGPRTDFSNAFTPCATILVRGRSLLA
jgi:uncharacterized protein (DUF433 family)